MLLGCLTTAATFFGLTWIDVPGLQELGRLVGVGMLLGGPLTLLLVAALLPARVKRPRGLAAAWLARFVRRHRWAILVGAGLATAAAVPLADEVRSRCPAPATATGHAGRPAAAGDRTTIRRRSRRGARAGSGALTGDADRIQSPVRPRLQAAAPAFADLRSRAACCPRSTNRPKRAGFWRPWPPTSLRFRRDCAPSLRTSAFDQAPSTRFSKGCRACSILSSG